MRQSREQSICLKMGASFVCPKIGDGSRHLSLHHIADYDAGNKLPVDRQ